MIVLIIIALILGLTYFDLLGKYAKLWESIPEPEDQDASHLSVTVVIPFRNEEKNLPRLINSLNILKLKGTHLDIVFVNDHSTDNGANYIINSNLKHPFQVFDLEENEGKKEALKLAWTEAKGDIILQTDADCILAPNWIMRMGGCFADDKIQLVSGPVNFIPRKELRHKIISLDFAALIAIGAAHIEWNLPMICNGANLAYRREVLERFNLKEHKASGDDVFLLQSTSFNFPNGIMFCKHNEAMVVTNGPSSFKEFWNQRIRWASKNGDYDLKKNTLILSGVWVFNLSIVLAFLSFSKIGLTIGAFLLLIKVLAEDRFYTKFASFFGFTTWTQTLLVGQVFHILYMTLLPPLSQILSFKWKGRKLK